MLRREGVARFGSVTATVRQQAAFYRIIDLTGNDAKIFPNAYEKDAWTILGDAVVLGADK